MATTNHRAVIIFDTEYTSWEGSLQRDWSEPWEHRELVQIAAVRTVETAAGFEAVDTLDLVVQPQVNREVSDYFVALTGLDRERIAVEGVSFQTALEAFTRFVHAGRLCSYGDDMLILEENCRLYGCVDPGLRNRYCNLHAVVAGRGIDVTQYTSGTLFQHFGLPLDKDKAHNAMWDVRSLLASMNAMNLGFDDLQCGAGS